MVKINVYYIAKNTKDLSDSLCDEFVTLLRNFNVKLEFKNLLSKNIKDSQKQDATEAKKSYSNAFYKVFKSTNQHRIALTPNGKTMDSYQFANMLEKEGEIAFFIGGAYGLEDEFLNSTHKQISLSKLTFSHKIAKIILSEQIYRAFCLLNNHPYHK